MEEFDSGVNPKIDLGDENTPIEPIQSALEKYNNHTHYYANTGNPFSMGISLDSTIEYPEDTTIIPNGTEIVELRSNSIVINTNSPRNLEDIRLIVDDNIVLDGCSINQNSDVVQLNPVSGFVNFTHVENSSVHDLNGSIDISSFTTGSGTMLFPLLLNTSYVRFLVKAKFVTDTGTATIDIASDDHSSSPFTEDFVVDNDLNKTPISYDLQSVDTGNTMLPIESSLTLLLKDRQNASHIFYHLKFYKVIL